jgi:hypothetical protein
MAKKKKTKRPIPPPMKTEVPQPAPQPIVYGNVFATFMKEAQSIGSEIEARRALQNEVAAFLAEKGLVDEFEAWRKARAQS